MICTHDGPYGPYYCILWRSRSPLALSYPLLTLTHKSILSSLAVISWRSIPSAVCPRHGRAGLLAYLRGEDLRRPPPAALGDLDRRRCPTQTWIGWDKTAP